MQSGQQTPAQSGWRRPQADQHQDTLRLPLCRLRRGRDNTKTRGGYQTVPSAAGHSRSGSGQLQGGPQDGFLGQYRERAFECDVARGLRDGTAIEQETEVARSFTGSFGFVAAATDGKSYHRLGWWRLLY